MQLIPIQLQLHIVSNTCGKAADRVGLGHREACKGRGFPYLYVTPCTGVVLKEEKVLLLRRDFYFNVGNPFSAVVVNGLPIANEEILMSVVLQ